MSDTNSPPPPTAIALPVGGIRPVADLALAGFAGTRAAQRLALLEADKDLVLRLMLTSYAGPEWQRFVRALAEYGCQVIRSWVRKGTIFAQCRRKGMGNLPVRPRSAEDSVDLATDVVVEAIHGFREKVLIPGKWDPTKGATLKTYFIGQCVLQFPNVYRRWLTTTFKPHPAPDALSYELYGSLAAGRPLHAHKLVELGEARIKAGSAQHMLALLELVDTHADVAELLAVSTRAVESKIYRHQRKEEER